jgi:hypothetical protein
VLTWPDRRPISPDWLTHRFGHLIVASGLPPVRLHDLRRGGRHPSPWPPAPARVSCTGTTRTGQHR